MDLRDDLTWVVIELTKLGEDMVSEGLLEAALRRDLDLEPSHPVFVPCTVYKREGRTTTLHLMEGYVFVATGIPEIRFFRLERKAYVQQVMSTRTGPHRMRYLSVVSHPHILSLQAQLREMVTSGIPTGARVAIEEGRYRGLDGCVVGLDEDNAFVRITLRSLDVVATVPRIFLSEEILKV